MGNPAPIVITATPAPTKTLAAESLNISPANNTATLDITAVESAATPLATIPSQPTATERICTPLEDWTEYEVQRGDNLTRIAHITGSTVDELIAANCLDNPNALRAGQMLFVPRIPVSSPTPRPSATAG